MSRKSVGGYGYRVAAFRRGRRWYLRWWDARAGKYTRRALGHEDRDLAHRQARDLASQLLAAAHAQRHGDLTLGTLLARYDRDVLQPGLVKRPREYRARADLWLAHLGADALVSALDHTLLDRFVAARRRGKVVVPGRRLAPRVSERTIGADVVFLQTALNWAVKSRLLESNPLRGYAAPKTPMPQRPVASFDRFEALRPHCDAADAQHRFGVFMDLVEGTGWRVSALCRLRAEDVDRRAVPDAPHGRLRKQAENDKGGVTQWIPLTAELRSALDRVPVLGGYLFPAPRNPERPWSRWHARDLLAAAEKLAGLAPIEGGAFHPYRRKWATERKHLPTADVMAAGGWTDDRSLKRSYQQADPATILAVMSEPRKLRDVR